MRFFANNIQFDRVEVTTTGIDKERVVRGSFDNKVIVSGVFDIFTGGNRLKAEIALDQEEQEQLSKLIESAARRFQRSINSQILSEIKQELR